MVFKRLLPLLLAAFLLSGCGGETAKPAFAPNAPEEVPEQNVAEQKEPPAVEAEPESPPEQNPKQDAVDTLLAGMTLEEKVGQMFFVRCPESGAEEKIGKFHLGGVLLFTRDFKNFAGEWLSAEAFMEKTASYQAASGIPLLIGVDEEGGTVARASRNPYLFLEKCKSPQEVYAQEGWSGIEWDAINKNRDLLSYGINVNFAPVADVSTDPADFIYDRSFGKDAQATAEYVELVVKSVNTVVVQGPAIGPACKMGCVLKHFPGYGSNVDTHTGIAVDERTLEQFRQEDFLPFQAGIEAGAGAVLVNHNIVTCMDGDFPSSLSPEVHRVLREELGFEGVVMTDDLAMGAVEAYAGDGSVAVLALLAGNDMIVTTDFEEQIPLVLDAVRTGLIDEDLVNQAVGRVLGWKFDLGLIGG